MVLNDPRQTAADKGVISQAHGALGSAPCLVSHLVNSSLVMMLLVGIVTTAVPSDMSMTYASIGGFSRLEQELTAHPLSSNTWNTAVDRTLSTASAAKNLLEGNFSHKNCSIPGR